MVKGRYLNIYTKDGSYGHRIQAASTIDTFKRAPLLAPFRVSTSCFPNIAGLENPSTNFDGIVLYRNRWGCFFFTGKQLVFKEDTWLFPKMVVPILGYPYFMKPPPYFILISEFSNQISLRAKLLIKLANASDASWMEEDGSELLWQCFYKDCSSMWYSSIWPFKWMHNIYYIPASSKGCCLILKDGV